MGVYIPYTRLPSAYQEVEYIQSSGTQYIDTGVSANQYLSYEAEITALGTTTDAPLFGARTGGESNRFGLIVYNNSFLMLLGNQDAFYGTPVDTKKHTLSVFYNSSNFLATLDGNTSTVAVSTSALVNQNFWLFNYNYGSVAPCPMKLYYFKLYTGSSTLVRDFVPCYRKSDNVIGMYDLVNDQFYTNSGSGTFSKGNDVTMVELKNAYIGEYKRTPGANTVVYLPLKENSNDQSGNGNNGTNTNITFSNGKAVFNTSGTSCILLDTTSLPTHDYTLHMIVARTNTSRYQAAFRYMDDWAYDNARSYIAGYGTYTYGGVSYIQTNLGVCGSSASFNYGWANGDTSEHLLTYAVYEPGDTYTYIKFYIDGVYQTITSAKSNYYAGAKIGLGNRWDNKSEGLRGTMREVIMENRVWTDAEILELATLYGFAS